MGNDLAQRVSAQRNGVAENDGARTLGEQIRSMQSQYQLAMPKGMEAAQLIRDAITAVRNTPKLDQCEPTSVLGALMNCAQLGLRPGVLDHAWVLPFWDYKSRGFKAQLILGYKGYIELGYRHGRVASLMARTVHANDVYDVDYGVNDNLVHKPFLDGPRGEARAFYTVVKYTNGGYVFYNMSKSEVEEHRDQYATTKTKEGVIFGPWKDNFEGMALKTTVRMVSKYMPKSAEFASAMAVDGGLRVDLEPGHAPEDATVRVERDAIAGEVLPESGQAPMAGEFEAMQAAMGGGSDG
jgi:recombination protein RecT